MSAEHPTNHSLAYIDVINILRSRWKLVLVVAAAFVMVGVVLAFAAKKYRASGSLWIQPGTASMYRTSPPNSQPGEASDKIASETRILQSRTLYLHVADQLGLYHQDSFVGKSAASKSTSISRDKMYRLMDKAIVVSHNPKDQLVELSATTKSAALSARIVNALITAYIDHIFQMHYGASKRTSDWLETQLSGMRSKVEHDQEVLVDLQARLGIVGTDPKNSDSLLAETLSTYTRASGEATIDRIVAEAKYRYLKDSDPDLIEGGQQILGARNVPNSGQGTLIQQLRSSRAQEAANYARLLAQFGHNYPEVKQLKAELDATDAQVRVEQTRILTQSKLAYLAASENQKQTDSALARKRDEVTREKGDLTRYALLQHQYDADRTEYEGLVQRLQEATLTSGLASSEVDVVDMADVPTLAEPPGRSLLLISSLVLGVFAGCSLALVSEALDDRVKLAEVEDIMQIPLLAVLPHIPAGTAVQPAKAFVVPGSPYAEAINSLRAALLLTGPNGFPHVVMITSADYGAGKSTVARNLAAALAQSGTKTALVDCDRRSNGLTGAFGLKDEKSLKSALNSSQESGLELALVKEEQNLFILTSGLYSAALSSQLSSPRLSDLTNRLKRDFCCIVLDAPPLVGPADALFLSRLADATVFVSREKVSTRRALVQLRKRAETVGLKAVGLIHNDVPLQSDRSRSSYAVA